MSISSRRFLEHRADIEAERELLLAEKIELDAQQQVLAARMASINRRLHELRDELWPRSKYRMGWILKRPPIGGPPAIPPPAPDATPLSGAQLRYAALAIVHRARRAITLTEIHRAIVLGGYRIDSRTPVKALGDALGYEDRRGTAIRVERGTYRIGEINAGDRRRLARAFPKRHSHPIVGRAGGLDQPDLDEHTNRRSGVAWYHDHQESDSIDDTWPQRRAGSADGVAPSTSNHDVVHDVVHDRDAESRLSEHESTSPGWETPALPADPLNREVGRRARADHSASDRSPDEPGLGTA